MWERWLNSFPELSLLVPYFAGGTPEMRTLVPLNPVARLMLTHDEKVLVACVEDLIAGQSVKASIRAVNESLKGALLADIHLFAGAFHLAEGKFEAAVDALQKCYQVDPEPGLATRRICPSLRFLLRVSPCLLMPIYPASYGASLLYAVALWHNNQLAEALEVLREMVAAWGAFDEIKVVAGQIHLQRGQVDKALKALELLEPMEQDSLEVSRALYQAYAYCQRDEFRSAARGLIPAIRLIKNINPHLNARARLMLAECYERNGMLLNALRESGRVLAGDVPADVAGVMLGREERWVTELGLLSAGEIERMAASDSYYMYIPEQSLPSKSYSPLDTSRDPLSRLSAKSMSWRKRQEEEQELEQYRAELASGQAVTTQPGARLSEDAREFKGSIKRAEDWWPGRRETLKAARANEHYACPKASDVGHLAFDFGGTRETPVYKLTGEKQAAVTMTMASAILITAAVLCLLRTCVY